MPNSYWLRSFTSTEPDVHRPEQLNDTSRVHPRTLMAAFPVSEGYRSSFFHPEDERPIFRKQRMRFVDRLCWSSAILLLAWLCWAVLAHPSH